MIPSPAQPSDDDLHAEREPEHQVVRQVDPALDAVGVDRRGFREDLRLALHGRDHGPRRAEGEPGDETAEDDRDDDDDRDDLVGVEGRGEQDGPGGCSGQADHDRG